MQPSISVTIFGVVRSYRVPRTRLGSSRGGKSSHWTPCILGGGGAAPLSREPCSRTWWSIGGGGVSWHFIFAWEISRFKLTAKFPTRNSVFSANFSHTSSTHCGVWRGGYHTKSGGLCEISLGNIYHPEHGGDLSSVPVRDPPPPCPPHSLSYERSIATSHIYGGAKGA